ncbi:hypothetical protein [Brucella pituitosa]|uniref:hypothetical protein n=1 Tax=Brucella pituitosa TaxID=571256 RepID=UPI0009A1F98C|nr:hypothetical protein [Brucella pituitosa]
MANELKLEATEITMGLGLVDVTTISHDGKSGILFRPRPEHIPVGEDGELHGGEYWPVKGDVVIWIENASGASVIEKYLSAWNTRRAAPVEGLETEGWEVTRYDNDGRWLETSLHIVEPRITGSEPTDTDELVHRSQAEAIIAGRDAVIETQADSIDKLERKVQHWQEEHEKIEALIAAKDAEIARLRDILDITERNELREAENNAALTARVKYLETENSSLRDKLRNDDLETQLAAARSALTDIASLTQTTDLLWWQKLARAALEAKP